MNSRRQFLASSITSLSAAWVAAHWPAALAAAQHAHAAVQSGAAAKFGFFTPEMAAEVDCITARIIPTGETPGAREAGVVYFIDRALTTFARGDQKLYIEGIVQIQATVRKMFPGIARFSTATKGQQDEILRAIDDGVSSTRPFASRPPEQSFFETLRQHTIAGFLIDPESDRRGNRDGVGWKLIGREREHLFQPPFGHYDKEYAGWQAAAIGAEKK